MGWTKRQVVAKAYGVTGVAEANMDTEELLEGMTSLDAMMASWEGRGMRLGYLASNTPTEGDLGQDTGLPPWAIQAVYLNLGIELAAVNGREVMPDTRALAERALNAVRLRTRRGAQMKLGPGVPAGGGNRRWRGQTGDFIVDDEDDLSVDGTTEFDFK